MFRKLLITFLCFTSLVLLGNNVFAEELPYVVKPILPENQDTGIKNYISIIEEEGNLTQEVFFEVENQTEDEIEIFIEPINALTSPNGIIQYIDKKEDKNMSIIDDNYVISQYINIDIGESIVLQGGELKKISATVNVEDIEGTILGAIKFKTLIEGKTEVSSNFRLNNEINTIIGFQLNFDTDLKENFIIGEPYVETTPSIYILNLPIKMDSPVLVKDSLLEYKITDSNNNTIFTSDSSMEVDFAPMTEVNLSLPWRSDSIKDGETYKITGKITSGDTVEEFEKEFTFEEDKNSYKNEDNSGGFDFIDVDGNNNIIIYIILFTLVIIMLVIIILLLLRKNKREDKDSDSKEIEVEMSSEDKNDLLKEKDNKN